MIELIAWIFLTILLFAVTLLLHYWSELFSEQEQYTRSEILGIPAIFKHELAGLLDHGQVVFQVASLAAGIAFSWFLVLLGGLAAPDGGIIPDHATESLSNYFFQSVLILPIIHGIWPFIKDLGIGSPSSLPALISRTEMAFFTAVSCSLAAIPLSIWGVYHQTSFLFSLFNAVIAISYAVIRLRLHRPGEEEFENESFNAAFTGAAESTPSSSFASPSPDEDDIMPLDLDDLDESPHSDESETESTGLPGFSDLPAESDDMDHVASMNSDDLDDLPGLDDFDLDFTSEQKPEQGSTEEKTEF